MKKEIRIIGIDDSPFSRDDKENLVIATFYRGGIALDGVMSCRVEKDGDDSTQKIAEMVLKSKFKHQVKCIFLDGIAVAGFNIIDIHELYHKTKIPIIVVMRKEPDILGMEKALRKIGQHHKMALIEKAGAVVPLGTVYAQIIGTSREKAHEFLAITCTRSDIPEPLRAAHLIAAGIALGESSGRA
jgi:endonuclease V-like protein UPF0215 family